LQNLSLTDLLFVTICIPPTAVDYAEGWPFGPAWCSVVQFLIHLTTYGSVYTLVLLSLDRYMAVVYPVQR
jgi:allatostatin receptor